MSLWDIIVWPFARLLELLYNSTHNYGAAIILFALVVNVILFPFMAKSKKSMMRTSRIQPQLKELERKCGGNQQRYQIEVQKLYKEMGVNPMSGCLWSLIPFPILIALYGVIRQPLVRMMGLSADSVEKITKWATDYAGYVAEGRNAYGEIGVMDAVHRNWDAAVSALGDFGGKLYDLDYSFIGLNLGQIPQWEIWNYDWSSVEIWLPAVGMFLIPVIAAALSWASMKISQATNPPQAGQAAASMKSMNIFMPIMSIWICFSMPAALGVYWIANSIFGIVRDVVLTKVYKAKLDKEDAERITAAKERELELQRRHEETERLRAEGATTRNTNTSKKKVQAQNKQASDERRAAIEKAEREAKRERLGVELEENPSQVGKRRYARGRAYDPNRYASEMPAAVEETQTAEVAAESIDAPAEDKPE